MGHVDHGKSTLIETLRQINITGQEAGGITQHIGAYKISHHGRPVTIIDTPGHAAFAKMRSRGAQVTDLVLLVVAADEGVKPQTKESLEHIKAAGVPFIVVITKIDLPQAAIDKVKSQLAEAEVYLEGYGGNVVCVPVSAKTGKNLDQLLDMVLLLADLQEETADPGGELKAVVIESKLDSRRGPIATLLIKSGSLKPGQEIWAEAVGGKVKAMFDDKGAAINQAVPGDPVEVLGFKTPPPVGAPVGSHPGGLAPSPKTYQTPSQPSSHPQLKLILKADVQGSLEAVKHSLSQDVELIAASLGAVTEADVLLAEATGAQILAFNTPVAKGATKLAQVQSITIKSYRVIYELLEDLEKQVLTLLQPLGETELGQAQVVAQFTIQGNNIAGCRVTTGLIQLDTPIHLQRGETIIADAQVTSLKQGKQTVNQVPAGQDCGLVLTPPLDFKIGDVIVSYRKLSV